MEGLKLIDPLANLSGHSSTIVTVVEGDCVTPPLPYPVQTHHCMHSKRENSLLSHEVTRSSYDARPQDHRCAHCQPIDRPHDTVKR